MSANTASQLWVRCGFASRLWAARSCCAQKMRPSQRAALVSRAERAVPLRVLVCVSPRRDYAGPVLPVRRRQRSSDAAGEAGAGPSSSATVPAPGGKAGPAAGEASGSTSAGLGGSAGEGRSGGGSGGGSAGGGLLFLERGRGGPRVGGVEGLGGGQPGAAG
jgi:hypothetical protein